MGASTLRQKPLVLVPEMVDLGGGVDQLSRKGADSVGLAWGKKPGELGKLVSH